jgi:hypothetical protein
MPFDFRDVANWQQYADDGKPPNSRSPAERRCNRIEQCRRDDGMIAMRD